MSVNREPKLYEVTARVGDAKWQRSWFQYHVGGNRRTARKMVDQAKKAYAHWPRLAVRLRVWVRPARAGTHGWMTVRQP